MIHPNQARRYISIVRWLLEHMTRDRHGQSLAVAFSGAASRLASFGAFIGTFHIIVMIVMNRATDTSESIPGLTAVEQFLPFGSELFAGLSIVVLLYVTAIGIHILSAKLTRRYVQDVEDHFTRLILKNRMRHLHVRWAQTDLNIRKQFTHLVKNDILYYQRRLKPIVNNIQGVIETGLTLTFFICILLYFVPELTFMIISVSGLFAFFVAPSVYRKEVVVQNNLKERREDVKRDKDETFDAFETSVKRNDPELYIEKLFSLESFNRVKNAEYEQKRVKDQRNILQYLLMFIVLAFILIYFGTNFDGTYLSQNVHVMYVIVVVLAIRFTLINFRQIITQWLNFNSHLRELQEIQRQVIES